MKQDFNNREFMRRRDFLKKMKAPVLDRKGQFIVLALLLLFQTGLSLLLPEILGAYIDRLETEGNTWLVFFALGYCVTVLLKGCMGICNTYVSEILGWRLCDHLRVDLFQRILSFGVQRHKTSQEGDFLERIEGDVSLLTGFFSTMAVDILESVLMVLGILVLFYLKYVPMGVIFTFLTLVILAIFTGTQNPVAALWKKAREGETDVLDVFSRAAGARKDIQGLGKQGYVGRMLRERFVQFEKAYARASFLGNIPAVIFFSLLNLGEGIALALGIYLLHQGRVSVGEVYLMLSYVTLLNMPFYSLKYEFSRMPGVLAAMDRICEMYGSEECETAGGGLSPGDDRSVEFRNVSFGYLPGTSVLRSVSFRLGSGEHLMIQGRTGSGKSTVLQLAAGFYPPREGEILIGGRRIDEYRREEFNRFLYYILQANPILEDTVRNNVTRYDSRYSDEEICGALRQVKMEEWLSLKPHGLDEILDPGSVSRDEAQLLAWAGAILRRPGILLADEFDAAISKDTVRIIDGVADTVLKDTTVILVTHQNRSHMHIHRKLFLEPITTKA